MLKTEVILRFCENTSFFTSKPSRNCLIEAMRLDYRFGLFIKESMVAGTKYESAEDFIHRYKQSCSGTSGHS